MKVVTKKDSRVCCAYRCKELKANKKKFCHKHHARSQKENNLIGYTYSLLKQNAKRREKEFDLTIDQFQEFCDRTNYLALKGKSAESASIDRIDPKKGYTLDNLQVLSLQSNSAKQWTGKNNDAPF